MYGIKNKTQIKCDFNGEQTHTREEKNLTDILFNVNTEHAN